MKIKNAVKIKSVKYERLKAGDYVLAAKYNDADPEDHFVVGYFDSLTHHKRHNIVDSEGKQFRHNGFRWVRLVNRRRGAWLVRRMAEIERSGVSVRVWALRRMRKRRRQPREA